MPRSTGQQKLRLIYLYRLFFNETDELHPKTRAELCEMLEKRHDIVIDRKTFYDDLAYFELLGIDILKGERANSYFLGEREFELPELHLLIDAIQSSKFITNDKTEKLIDKITTLCSVYQANDIRSQVSLSARNKTVNEAIYYNIDAIYHGISNGKQISFLYFNWVMENGKLQKEYRKNGRRYQVSPWAVTWNDEKYYLIAYDADRKQLRHYRIDKMEKIDVEKKPRLGQQLTEHFDSGAYTAKHFNMYGGEEQQVKLRFTNDLLGVAVDQFGKSAFYRPDDEKHFILITDVVVSPQFYGFLFSLGKDVELLEPEAARTALYKYASKMKKTYKPPKKEKE